MINLGLASYMIRQIMLMVIRKKIMFIIYITKQHIMFITVNLDLASYVINLLFVCLMYELEHG